jgi:hypothetical protein
MDEEYGRSLRKLLPDLFEQMEDVVKAKLSSEPGADWGRVPKFAWNFVGSKATEAVHDVLGMDAFEIIARAWAKAVELREYNDPVKYPADKVSKTHLFDHKLTANLHPVIEVTILGFGRTKLKFTLELTARFRSAELHIKGGRIVAVAAGDCSASAQLKYGDIKLHKEVKTEDLKVGRPLTLEPALTIG